ncbi:UNVERIFIED_CONTAM: hypothetical protein GTU68_005970 [Idotea baltica]|nr:hypothetical protein [Idotea baltica]
MKESSIEAKDVLNEKYDDLPQKRKVYTLLLLHQDNKILLGYKKRGFGQGKWNGFGGKCEEGETIRRAAFREMKEESGLDMVEDDVKKVGILEFTFVGKPVLMEVHIFKASKFSGVLSESDGRYLYLFNMCVCIYSQYSYILYI